MSTNANQKQLQAKVDAMFAGWTKTGVFTPPSVVVRGQVLTGADVAARLRAFLDLLEAPDKAFALYRAAVANRRAGSNAGWQFFEDLASVVTQQFGDQEAHERFGIPLPKAPTPPSTETLVLANDQRQKTRKARGIMGRRQREAITTAGTHHVVILDASGAPVEPPAK